MARAERSITIAAAPEECFAALVDYESMPAWQSSLRRVEVLARDGEGRGSEVAYELDAKVRSVSYTLSYEYEQPGRIQVGYVSGDMKNLAGAYEIEPEPGGDTRVTLSLDVDPGRWVPGPVKRVLEGEVMARSLKDLRDHLERG